jgi:hypothetical protein
MGALPRLADTVKWFNLLSARPGQVQGCILQKRKDTAESTFSGVAGKERKKLAKDLLGG